MAKKILMALQGLNIGGAETHVVELSLALCRRGYDVVVVSNGGVYEKTLLEGGVRCLHAPLHRRSAATMLKALCQLRRIIREEKPDIVHAHARIPAFLCGLLQRPMGFAFVTTAHGVYYVNQTLRRLTNWGERTLAVSEDIRDYLVKSYGVPRENILLTVNGIDTDRFSPQCSGEEARRELGIPLDAPTVVHVSRLDAASTAVTRLLLEAAPRLREGIEKLHLVIVGSGEVYDELRTLAEARNAEAGKTYIHMTGARTDVPQLLAAGDLFVGVSRAALEAMAEEKPVLLAGSEGYIGLLTEEKLVLAQSTNLCCRGCGMADLTRLTDDMLHALALPAARRAALGRFGRALVQRDYSVERMTNDSLTTYRRVWASRERIVLSGYYGYRNLGDDAILLSLREQLSAAAPGAKLIALSNRPRETREKCDVDAVYRFNPPAVVRELKRCTVLVSGGGSLLQDSTSTRSLLYYTTILRLAKHYGKRVMFYANGIGPVRSEKNRARVRAVSEAADVITLRDEASLAALREMGVTRQDIRVTADPVYAMHGRGQEAGLALLREQGVRGERPLIGVSVRFTRGTEDKAAELARFCDALAERAEIAFLILQQGKDEAAAQAVRAQMHAPSVLLSAPYDPAGMMSMLSCMQAVVSTRLHSVIFAACERVRVLGIVYDPKVSACLDTLGMPAAGTLAEFNADTALAALDALLEDKACAAPLDAAVAQLSACAEENIAAFRALLDGKENSPC